jgi:hypothetical protein
MKNTIITISIIVAMLALSGFAVAQELTSCGITQPQVCPACTPVLNCGEVPACPACPSLNCADTALLVPGLWEVTSNKKFCGEITLGPSWVIINDETLLLNKVKRMVRVEACN